MKRLTRSRKDRLITGVVGGLGRYFGIDPTLLRIATAIVTLLVPWPVIPLYILATFIIPEGDEEGNTPPKRIRLYRSRSDRMIAGVCSGLAKELHVDPTWVRIVWAVLIIPGWGLPVLLYVLAALILPEKNADEVVYSKDLS